MPDRGIVGRSCGFGSMRCPDRSCDAGSGRPSFPPHPDGIVLPKPDSAADAIRLDHYLQALEVAAGLEVGRSFRILPIATETPRALFALNGYAGSTARLISLTWGAEDLPAALGALANRDEDGNYSDVCRLARTLMSSPEPEQLRFRQSRQSIRRFATATPVCAASQARPDATGSRGCWPSTRRRSK